MVRFVNNYSTSFISKAVTIQIKLSENRQERHISAIWIKDKPHFSYNCLKPLCGNLLIGLKVGNVQG